MNAPTPAALPSRTDRAGAIVWIVLGAAMLHGGWTMDRLEALNINPYTAPGVVPALLGAGLVVLGVLLLWRASRSADPASGQDGTLPPVSGRFWLALVLCLLYGAVLVGRGLPFWLATFLFVFVAIAALQWPARRAGGTVHRGMVVAALCAAGTAAAVTLVFQELFLVRLP